MATHRAPHVHIRKLKRARQLAVLLLCITIVLSVTSVRYLADSVTWQQRHHAGASTSAQQDGSWQDMLSKVEHNLEAHLPHHFSEPILETGPQTYRGVAAQQQAASAPALQSTADGPWQDLLLAASSADSLQTSAKSTARSKAKQKLTADKAVCHMQEHTEYPFGEAVKWGSSNKVETWGECCQQCLEFVPAADSDYTCTTWVWCGDPQACGSQFRECWLKYLVHAAIETPRTGAEVPWTSGYVPQEADPDPEDPKADVEDPDEDRRFHVVITAEGSAPHWQSRVHYYWYKKTKAQCEAQGKCDMGGFTRILHSGKPDDLINEMPTFVAQPLPRSQHDNKGYVVLNRPYAFVQWVQQAKIKERYVLMSEPDHVWLKPMPNLMKGQHPAAFSFFYISPSTPQKNLRLTQKYTGTISKKEANKIAPIGNAPTMVSWEQLVKVAPMWMNISLAIFHDEETAKEWGWVQEMYAFTIACYNARVPKVGLHPKMMSQPPWDSDMEPFYLLHYTYGMDYSRTGKFLPGKYGEWRFDKRTYANLPPPRHLGEPPPGMANKLVRHLIHAINEASSVIPGWDEYAATGVAKEIWNGILPV